jgi:hypothetical protein
VNQRAQSPAQGWNFIFQAWSAGGFLEQASVDDVDDLLELYLPAGTYKVRFTISTNFLDNVKFYLPYLGLKRDNYLEVNY